MNENVNNGFKFWENEDPVEIKSVYGRIAYYQKAKRLQISRPDWTDENGETRCGKTVTLMISRFKGNEQVKQILNMAISDL